MTLLTIQTSFCSLLIFGMLSLISAFILFAIFHEQIISFFSFIINSITSIRIPAFPRFEIPKLIPRLAIASSFAFLLFLFIHNLEVKPCENKSASLIEKMGAKVTACNCK